MRHEEVILVEKEELDRLNKILEHGSAKHYEGEIVTFFSFTFTGGIRMRLEVINGDQPVDCVPEQENASYVKALLFADDGRTVNEDVSVGSMLEGAYHLTDDDENEYILNLVEKTKQRPLRKTTIVIWSEYDGSKVELENLAWQATRGDAYCSKQETVYVENPEKDPDWDNTEFFADNEQ